MWLLQPAADRLRSRLGVGQSQLQEQRVVRHSKQHRHWQLCWLSQLRRASLQQLQRLIMFTLRVPTTFTNTTITTNTCGI